MEATQKSSLRSGLRSRTGVLVAAGIAAALAGVLVFGAINSARNDSSGAAQILVADKLIPKGSAAESIASQHLYRSASISENGQVAGAVADVSAISGQVAVKDIYPGQQISTSDFGAAGAGLTAQLSDAERAITVPVDSSHGMTGQLQPGDHVDVYTAFNLQNSKGVSNGVIKLLARDVVVLRTPSSGNNSTASGSLTLRATDKLAPRLAFAADNGKLWIVLRPAVGAVENAPDSVSVQNLVAGTKPLRGSR